MNSLLPQNAFRKGQALSRPVREDVNNRGPERIDCLVEQLLKERSMAFQRSAGLLQAWDDLLPPEIRRLCRPARLENGVLIIESSPGPCRHYLQTMSGEIVSRLKQLCPQSRIQKIRICSSSPSVQEASAL